MRYLLLLLSFLMLDLLQDTVANHNELHGTAHLSPAQDLIDRVWCCLCGIACTGETHY